jgi:hypothetical protein
MKQIEQKIIFTDSLGGMAWFFGGFLVFLGAFFFWLDVLLIALPLILCGIYFIGSRRRVTIDGDIPSMGNILSFFYKKRQFQ